jgi:SAM-dependent methyltransferase
MGLKLNLGSGQRPQPGYANVDKFGDPDLKWDLEAFPWPWPDNSVSEILMTHVLEHLGATADMFIRIMKELYRVCEPGAKIYIAVPHPRHEHFIDDPTHVRPVTPNMLKLFSRRENLRWREMGSANTPLALYHAVDFEITDLQYVLAEPYAGEFRDGRLRQEDLDGLLRKHNNVASEIRITLDVIKS